MGKFIDLTGQTFGDWEVVSYNGNSYWNCKCTHCGQERVILGYKLKNSTPKCDCTHERELIIPIGTVIDDVTVIGVTGTQDYDCKCKCGRIVHLKKYDLTHGRRTICGHVDKKDLTGKKFGEWTVLRHSYDRMWTCQCSCGTIRDVQDYSLTHGKSLSCGHPIKDGNKVEVGEHINHWTVLENLGYGKFRCRCDCGNESIVNVSSLRYGYSKSCGCANGQLRKDSMLSKYGEVTASKIKNKREVWQIDAVSTKENFKAYIEALTSEIDGKPTTACLMQRLGVNRAAILKAIHKFGLEDIVEFDPVGSAAEDEIKEFIGKIYKGEIITHFRGIQSLDGYEVDIYIPDKKLAIEFNGDYWHSSIFKGPNYHLDKTLKCAKAGIRLIHIFQYEWEDAGKKQKIKDIIASALGLTTRIYARHTVVREIDNQEAVDFCNKYHLQSGINSKISLGMFYKNQLIGVMTFGGLRYSNTDEIEMYRLAFKSGITVVGGASKLFKYFINNYKYDDITSYCNISKFTGSSYIKLGFETAPNMLSKPSYVWKHSYKNKVLSRYQTQKQSLIANGLGRPEQTEDEIMDGLGYLKIYDCGNLKLIWRRK